MKTNVFKIVMAILMVTILVVMLGMFTKFSGTNDNKNGEVVNEQIDWEDYTDDIDGTKLELDTYDFENISTMSRHTAYSLIKAGYDSIDYFYNNAYFLYKYALIGDVTNIVLEESNYNYPREIEDNSVMKYNDIISYKVAETSESAYNKAYSDKVLDDFDGLDNLNIDEKISLLNRNYEGEYTIDKMVIMNGNNMTYEDYINNARAKKIRVTINDECENIFELEDTNRVQIFDINYVQNTVKKPVDIKIEVLESYEGNITNDIYISDIVFGISGTGIPQGR